MNDNYNPSPLVQFLHQIPHLSFKFVWLDNPSFTVDNEAYLESLVIVLLMPVVLLLVSMICFLIYYCCVKIKQAAPNKANSSSCYCSICLIIIFVMIAFAGIGILGYGTIQVHEGISSASYSTTKINQSFAAVTDKVINIDKLIYKLKYKAQDLGQFNLNESMVASIHSTIESLQIVIIQLPHQETGVNDRLEWLLKLLSVTEEYRTIVTYSVMGVFAIVCLLALMGICFRSRCLLITTVFIGLVCLVVSYLYIGIIMMVDVAVADLCMEPYNYIVDQAVDKQYIDNGTAQYYLTCSSSYINETFTSLISNATNELFVVDSAVTNIGKEVTTENVSLVLDDVHEISYQLATSLHKLSEQIDCKDVNEALKEFIPSICFSTMDGLFILGISAFCVSLALTVVLFAAPQTWKRFSKRKATEDLDLDEVFLPTPARQPSVSRTNNPLYVSPEERYYRHVSNNTTQPVATNTLSFMRRSEEDMTLLESPPPEYSPPRSGSEY